MKTRTVMISLALTLVPFLGSNVPIPSSGAGPSEPAGPFNAVAAIEALSGSESQPQAKAKFSFTSLLQDAEVTLQAEPRRPGEKALVLGRLTLEKGQKRDLRVTVDLQPGVNNELQFTARARKADGTEEIQSIYLQVPLDPGSQPELVDEYVQYRGAVQPAGGGQ